MGYAIAQAAVDAGAKTILISGPTALATPEHVTRVDVTSADDMHKAARVDVTSADDMHKAALAHADECDIFIASAAVADFKPAILAEQKIKKTMDDDTMTIEMIKNPDIVADIAATP